MMSRQRRPRLAPDVTEAQWAFLNDALTDDIGRAEERWALRHDAADGKRHRSPKALWQEFGALVLARWVDEAPGTRPALWWQYDAPEPRRRVGGIGRPLHEFTAYVVRYAYGVPIDWPEDDPDLPAEFRPPCAALIDPNDPPLFESQAAFLDRHDLLSPAERDSLDASAFDPEPVTDALLGPNDP